VSKALMLDFNKVKELSKLDHAGLKEATKSK